MKLRRQNDPELPLEHVARQSDDALFCEWSSYTHNWCHLLAHPGQPFCPFHCAAVFGMARGASAPDPQTRAKFEQVWEHFVDADDQSGDSL